MTQLIPFEFDQHQVRVVQGDDGEPWFVARDVAASLEYRDASHMSRMLDDDEKGYTEVATLGGDQRVVIINESGLYHATFASRKSSAKRFRRWVTEDVLPSVRKRGRYEVSPTQPATNVAATMALVECAASLLRASDSGKVIMLRKAGMAVGADTSFLPVYTEDSAPGHVGAMDTSSLSQLLSERGCSLSAATANQILIRLGLLESRKRKGSNGQSKEFKCITQAGQEYGKNIVSPQSPRETQPHWYRERFDALLLLMAQEGAA